MPSYLDLGLIAIILVSALLSMVRGFTREVLAIASWARGRRRRLFLLSACSALRHALYPQGADRLGRSRRRVVFFVTLILVSIFTVDFPTRSSTARSARSTGRSASCSARRAASCSASSPSRSSTGWSPRSSSRNGSRRQDAADPQRDRPIEIVGHAAGRRRAQIDQAGGRRRKAAARDATTCRRIADRAAADTAAPEGTARRLPRTAPRNVPSRPSRSSLRSVDSRTRPPKPARRHAPSRGSAGHVRSTPQRRRTLTRRLRGHD